MNYLKTSWCLIFLILLAIACNDSEDVKSSAKVISSFDFSALNPKVTGTISETDKKISLTVPSGTDVSALVPTVAISEKATVSPASGIAQNFSNPVKYTVTAEDGSRQEYVVTVIVTKASSKSITLFDFSALNPKVTGIISEADKKISLIVPVGTDVSKLVPTITISEKASVLPASGVAQNFANPVKYTVTAEDGSQQEYTVTVTAGKSPFKLITSIELSALNPKVVGVISEVEKKISLTVPSGTDVSKLAPAIVISEKATVSPVSGIAQNFANPVKYTVTAEDGSQQEYVVTVTVGKSPLKSITSFDFSALNPKITGTISEVDKKISLTVSLGTVVTALVPAIVISEGATISPASGIAQNFTNPVKYTVTAEDGSQQGYLVTVVVPKSSAKSITSIKFSELTPEVVGAINESTKHIIVTVPNGTSVTALKPTIVISEKATISPASGVAKDFTNPVSYIVTAEDGTLYEYLVTVTVDPTVNFTVNPVSITELQQDNILFVTGTNFGPAANNKIVLKNTTTNVTTELPVIGSSSETILFVRVPANQPLGNYKVTVFIGAQSKELPEAFTVVYHAPSITSLDKVVVERNGNIIVTGAYFQQSGNVVKLGSTVLTIVSESTTSIEVKVPISAPLGLSTLNVTSNGKTSFYNTTQVKVELPANTPVISSLDKFSYSRGQTITITGTNLKKNGVATNIKFERFTSGTNQVKEGVPNSDGTQVTFLIPIDFITGTYVITVEVDGLISEEYGDVIQINP